MSKKEYYKKVVTWKKKPNWLGIMGFIFTLLWVILMCFDVEKIRTDIIICMFYMCIFFAIAFLYSTIILMESFGEGRKVRYLLEKSEK